MVRKVVEIRGTEVRVNSQSQESGTAPSHEATYGIWPRGSMGEDAVEDIGTCGCEKQAA